MQALETPAPDRPAVGDREAVAEVTRGNREMFEVLVRRHNQLLFRVGVSYLRKPELVEDAMQNAYLKAFTHLNRFRGGSAFSTWITRIMINECLMLLRRQRTAREETTEPDALASAAESVPPQGEAQASLKEMKAVLEQAIAALPQRYRTVYVLREVQQMTTAEAAASLGVSAESVKVSLHRAREMLKTRLLASAAGMELFAYEAPRCNRMTARVMAAVLAVV